MLLSTSSDFYKIENETKLDKILNDLSYLLTNDNILDVSYKLNMIKEYEVKDKPSHVHHTNIQYSKYILLIDICL